MADLIRFGVSLNESLLQSFDELIKKKGYANRSEAIRDLIRERLVEDEWEDEDRETVGVFSFVYDHHSGDLASKINAIQHDHYEMIRSTTHFHIDHDNCLEVIILTGTSRKIRMVSDQLSSTRGIKHSRLIMTSRGSGIR